MATDDKRALLQDHVRRFNRGVRTGNFAPMVETFHPDAQMIFEGVPVGPFFGREAIREAYAAQPPSDELVILRFEAPSDDTIVARYAWKTKPEEEAGTMTLTVREGLVSKLVVRFA